MKLRKWFITFIAMLFILAPGSVLASGGGAGSGGGGGKGGGKNPGALEMSTPQHGATDVAVDVEIVLEFSNNVTNMNVADHNEGLFRLEFDCDDWKSSGR